METDRSTTTDENPEDIDPTTLPPETEEELHERLWAFVEGMASVPDYIEHVIGEDGTCVECGLDMEEGDISQESCTPPWYTHQARKLLDLRALFAPGVSEIVYPKRRWLSLAGLERRAWRFVEYWANCSMRISLAGEEENNSEEFCLCCFCNLTKGESHNVDCVVTMAQELLDFRSRFPSELAACREAKQRRPPLPPRDPSEPIERRRTWKGEYRPNLPCLETIGEHLVPGRDDIPTSEYTLDMLNRCPTGTAIRLRYEPDTEFGEVTWFCHCRVTVVSPLAQGPFPVHGETGRIYPTTPGVYDTWLWKEQVHDCREAGCEVVVGAQGGWAWVCQTRDNTAWKALCADVEKRDPVPGELGIPNNAASHLYDLGVRAGSDPSHPWMTHWFAYTIMQVNRASYHAALHSDADLK